MTVVRRSAPAFAGQRRLRRRPRAGLVVGLAAFRRSCWPGSTVA